MLRNFCVHTVVDVIGHRRKMEAGSSSLKHFSKSWGEQQEEELTPRKSHQCPEVLLSLDPHCDPEDKSLLFYMWEPEAQK